MERYITFRDEEDKKPKYYILQRDFPHFIGEVSTTPDKHLVGATPIPGYKLWIVFQFCLRGKSVPSYRDLESIILNTMNDMASWYFQNRIETDQKRFLKFKI